MGGGAAVGILGIIAAFSGGAAALRGNRGDSDAQKIDEIRVWLEQLVKQHGSLQKALAGLEDDAPLPPGVVRERIRAVQAVFAGGIDGIEARLAEHGEFARCIRDSMVELEASDEQFRSVLSNLIDFAVEQRAISERQLEMLGWLVEKLDAVLDRIGGISRVQREQGETLANIIDLDLDQREKMGELGLREKIREHIEDEYSVKLAAERDARVAAERAAESVMLVRDMPGIVEALREKGGQAIIDALLAREEVSETDQIHRHRAVAEWAYLVGNIEQADQSLRILLEYNADDPDAINRMGHVHRLRGEFAEAEARYRRVLELAGDDQSLQAVAYENLGSVLEDRGDLAGAEAMYRKALEINERLGCLEGMAKQYGNLEIVMYARGDLVSAEEMHREAMSIGRRQMEDWVNREADRGDAREKQGNLAGAETMYRAALLVAEHLGFQELMAKIYPKCGFVKAQRGDLVGAEEMFRKALEIEEKLGRLEGMVKQYTNLGNMMFKRGDLEGAEEMYRSALEMTECLGLLEETAHNYANLGSVMAMRGDVSAARAMWRKARGLFEQIGMKHEVEKVDGMLRGLDGERE